ncbi:MAG: ABC transporter ATP-binding protein [Treponema sp.]|jgi:ABC-2 type transport system ATP-binding protein|nr:ABC transporter ATP-binding protein [Treponema sp.]
MSRDARAGEPAGPPLLAVEGLTKIYGRKKAVSGVSFSARRAELIGLLGPNGAGKSSTLRMIAGCLAPTAGRVRVAGFDAAEQPGPAKSRIGYLPETPPLYPDMTVREYLRFARELKKTPRGKRGAAPEDGVPGAAAKDAAAWMDGVTAALEIGGVMPTLIRNLSRGYRQRVGIAASLAGRPALLLLDEPGSGLDPRQAAELRLLLESLSPDMAIVVSSHDLYEISSLCTRIIIMKEGRVAADGSPGELARLGGGPKTELEVSGDPRLAAEILRACAEGRPVIEKPGGEGRTGFVVHAGGADFRARVFRAFAARGDGLSLDTLKPSETNLEDLFISLTGPDVPPPRPPEES